ncbi:unnamed protein product [Closterium sp. Yama58-4]|nr:unnamed protein product [Closterium sp. Yama58-4]
MAEHAESHDLLLTTAGADGMVKIFSVESQQQLRSARVGSLPLASMALLPPLPSHCYPSVLLGSSDDHVWLYSPDFGRCLSKVCHAPVCHALVCHAPVCHALVCHALVCHAPV